MDRESEEIWRELRSNAPSPLTPPEDEPIYQWKTYGQSVTVDKSYWIGFCEGYEKQKHEATVALCIVVSATVLASAVLGWVIGKFW